MTNNRNAFTLMEILIVLAILGFGMGLVMEMTAASARHSERVEEDTIVQLACEKMMNSILAGDMTATVGVSTPIPDAPNWETSVELLDGPIDKLVAIRITARRFEIEEYPSPDGGFPIVFREPQPERVFVIKEWARKEEIKTRVVKVDSTGQTTAVDGTGETVFNDMNGANDPMGGGLGGANDLMNPADPFAAIDRATGIFGLDGGQGGLGGGLAPIGAMGADGGLGGGLGGGMNQGVNGYGGF